ncbi:Na-translocating system protein MpsC family protein, partial [Bacillus cereus group sp. Bce006]
ELVESGQDDLNDLIFEITGVKVSSFHSDLSTVTGERVIVFKLEDNFEKLINQG